MQITEGSVKHIIIKKESVTKYDGKLIVTVIYILFIIKF